MFTTSANAIAPIFGDYIYVGGGLLTLVLIVLVVVFLLRRV